LKIENEQAHMSGNTVADGVKVLTIGELTRTVKFLMEEAFPMVWVTGEVSNLTRHSSGHIYLTLKDREAQLAAVIWRSTAQRLRLELREGIEVIARGSLTIYPKRGQHQLVVDQIHHKGIGAQELALRELKERLLRLGYFAPERKKPLPRFPQRVALVTSPTGAALRDMLEILCRRWPATEVWVCPARVQGDGAAEQIAAALRLANRFQNVDVIIIGRGGGSIEDLWPFNAACVAEAIYASRIPVVSAVGHEIDLTIADLVADCRALTPSEAAERVVPDRNELFASLQTTEDRFRSLLVHRLETLGRRLAELSGRRCFRTPLDPIRERERRLDEWMERLERAMRQQIGRASESLRAQTARLESLSPLNVLGRGYSVTRRQADLAVLRSPEQVRPGELLVTWVQHGRIISRVEPSTEVTR
jgi:exodeoxyribonuclease VII large subunit